MNHDLCVKMDDGILNIRVGAIIMKDDKFLMVENDRFDHMYSVGGRIKFGETAEEAVVREVFEETGVKMEIDRLGFIHENFFPGDSLVKRGNIVHEISFFFYMKVPEDFEPVCNSFTEDGNKEHLVWIRADHQKKYYPEFFRTELFNPSKEVKHFVTNNVYRKHLSERFEFRNIRADEADQAVAIEQICFPPNEACSEKHMKERIAAAPELFLVAVDKETGKLAGFLNGLSTNEGSFRDEFFTDINLYNPNGKNIMLLGLDVLPEYRGQGLATEIVNQYVRRERENARQMLLLTCLDSRVEMYKKMGFCDDGIANSTWGGEEWHEMSCMIK